MLNFLVTNDDGIDCQGLHVLASTLSLFGQVRIVCPDSEKSGFSHAITTRRPLTLTHLEDRSTDRIQVYTVNGSPADTVNIAMDVFYQEQKPDFVVTGINAGVNAGQDIYYSGTVAAARQAVLHGVPAIATSLERQPDGSLAYQEIIPDLKRVLKVLLAKVFPDNTLINLNFPAYKPTRQETPVPVEVLPIELDARKFSYHEDLDYDGQKVYYLSSHYRTVSVKEGTDIDRLRKGSITVSPLLVKQNNEALLNKVQQWFNDESVY